jgi:peptide/nickel transport system permease protein
MMLFRLSSLRLRPASWLALGWLFLVLTIGLLAPWLPLPYAPTTPDLLQVAAPPAGAVTGPAHYLGTDPLGRDILAGLVAGARRLLLLTLPAVALATLLGILAGAAAGFWGNRRLRLPVAGLSWALTATWWGLHLPGTFFLYLLLGVSGLLTLLAWRATRHPAGRWGYTCALPLDGLVLGATTLLGAVPRLILLVALAAGPPLSTPQLLGLLTLLAWPETARLVRGQMRWVRAQPFIEAAQASGLPTGRIWWHHALPHACRPLLASTPLSLAGLVGLESSLAFLGIGQGPDVVSWGSQLATMRQDTTAWWVAVFPGLALLLTLLALQKLAAFATQATND